MQPGDKQAGYVRHLDAAAHTGTENRRLTFVYYFNPEVDGGEMRIHSPGRMEWFPAEGTRQVWDRAASDPCPAWAGVRPGSLGKAGERAPMHWDISPLSGRVVIFRR